MLGAYAYSSLPFAHRHWWRMVGHNAETNRVPRRIYICIRERAIRCACISISIDVYSARGLRSTSREGTDPIVRLTNIVLLRPAFERPASSLTYSPLSFYLFACVSVIFSFFFERRLIDGSKEDARRKRTVTRISGLTNFVTKWATQHFTRYAAVWFGKLFDCVRREFIPFLLCVTAWILELNRRSQIDS